MALSQRNSKIGVRGEEMAVNFLVDTPRVRNWSGRRRRTSDWSYQARERNW